MEHILPLLRDPVWQFIGVAAPLAAAALAYLIRRPRKIITCEIVSDVVVFTAEDLNNSTARLTVHVDAHRLEYGTIRVVVVRLANRGNVALTPEDYQGPLRMSFGDGSGVLMATVVATTPRSFDVSVRSDGPSLCLDPVLLNKQSSLLVKMLVWGGVGLRVSGGIKDFTLPVIPAWRRAVRRLADGFMGVAVVIGLCVGGLSLVRPGAVALGLGGTLVLIAGEGILLFLMAVWAVWL